MGIGPVSGISGVFPVYSTMPVDRIRGVGRTAPQSDGVAASVSGVRGVGRPGSIDTTGHKIGQDGKPEPTKQDKRVGKAECETCKERKYVDGSNDPCVSFKTPGHIDPGQSAARVMGHEQEHVNHARAEGQEENKELVSVSVTMHTSICPECGRVYVAGGQTHTQMKTTSGGDEGNSAKAMMNGYKGVSNPYEREMNKQMAMHGSGLNYDLTA